MNPNLVFLANLLSTWYMVGLIWMVQVVHYKLFDRVGEPSFVEYETLHARFITPLVFPPMLIEIVTAAWLLVAAPPGVPRWAIGVGLGAVVLIWLSTAFIQVPIHNRLHSGFDEADYRMLVATNWIRTICWTARGLLLGYYAQQLLR